MPKKLLGQALSIIIGLPNRNELRTSEVSKQIPAGILSSGLSSLGSCSNYAEFCLGNLDFAKQMLIEALSIFVQSSCSTIIRVALGRAMLSK
jgi:hypothetical protein